MSKTLLNIVLKSIFWWSLPALFLRRRWYRLTQRYCRGYSCPRKVLCCWHDVLEYFKVQFSCDDVGIPVNLIKGRKFRKRMQTIENRWKLANNL